MIPLPVVILAVLGVIALVAVWRRFWRDYQAGKAQSRDD